MKVSSAAILNNPGVSQNSRAKSYQMILNKNKDSKDKVLS